MKVLLKKVKRSKVLDLEISYWIHLVFRINFVNKSREVEFVKS